MNGKKRVKNCAFIWKVSFAHRVCGVFSKPSLWRCVIAPAFFVFALSGCTQSLGGVSETAAVSSAGISSSESGYSMISQESAYEMMQQDDGHIILDVRRQDEYDAGHIEGAVCIPNETIDDEPLPELPDMDQIILVYCRSGRRSKLAAQKLYDIGYTNVYEFGGIIDWIYGTVT